MIAANIGNNYHLRGVILPEGTERDIFIVSDRITFTPPERWTTILPRGYLIPGLVDMHAHLALHSPAPEEAPPEEQVRASARAQLKAGVLALREPGSPNHFSKSIGPHEGLPRTFTAGRFLASPGSYFPGLARNVKASDLAEAAAEESLSSGAWAKVIGDWINEDGHMRPTYPADALNEAARRVHAVGGRIAIHATHTATIEAAVAAQFDSIEHGTGLTESQIARMAAQGTALTPTLLIFPNASEWLPSLGMTPAETKAMLASCAQLPEMVRRAAEAGVLILAGTDAGMGPHGMVREEIGLLINAGLSPEDSLAAGSWSARRYLGLPGIEEGAPADLVAYPDDPRQDAGILGHPLLMILDGKLVLNPGERHSI